MRSNIRLENNMYEEREKYWRDERQLMKKGECKWRKGETWR